MKASAGDILVTGKPWGVGFGNVAAIFSPADDSGYLHGAETLHTPYRWIFYFSVQHQAVSVVELAKCLFD